MRCDYYHFQDLQKYPFKAFFRIFIYKPAYTCLITVLSTSDILGNSNEYYTSVKIFKFNQFSGKVLKLFDGLIGDYKLKSNKIKVCIVVDMKIVTIILQNHKKN